MWEEFGFLQPPPGIYQIRKKQGRINGGKKGESYLKLSAFTFISIFNYYRIKPSMFTFLREVK